MASSIRAILFGREPLDFAVMMKKCPDQSAFITAELLPAATSLEAAEYYAPACWNAYLVRQAGKTVNGIEQSLLAAPNQAPVIIRAGQSALAMLVSDLNSISELLESRIYSPKNKPEEPAPRFYLSGIPICTPGNLTAVSALVKAGKTAAIIAMLSSAFATPGADCLGFSSQNPLGFAVLHFDTEQSPYDHWFVIEQALKRAGVESAPLWLRSYCLTGLSPSQIPESIKTATKEAAKQFGGVHSIIIDGVADSAYDVNDPAEADELITELRGHSIKFNCPVINIIHVNPGSEKTRGHLGSGLERKSETNLRLEKDESGVTVIWSDKNRKAPIPKANGPRFMWSEQSGMHVSIQSVKSSKEEASHETLSELATAAFLKRPAMGRMELEAEVKTILTAVKKGVSVSDKTAERKVTEMVKLGIVKKGFVGLYTPTA